MYREIFSDLFPSPAAVSTVPFGKSIACSTAKGKPVQYINQGGFYFIFSQAIEWDAAFENCADPSGRAISGVHVDAYQIICG